LDEPGFEGFKLVKQVAPPPWVVYAASFSALSLVLLAAREVSFSEPIMDLPIFKRRAFDISTFLQVSMLAFNDSMDHRHRIIPLIPLCSFLPTSKHGGTIGHLSTQLVRPDRFDIGVAATRAYASGSGESPSGTLTPSAPMCRYCH